MKRVYLISILVSFVLAVSAVGHAQEPDDMDLGEKLTQEEFAVELIKSMGMEGWLPTAAIAGDCVALLERLSIMPLSGWDNKSLLTQEDYLTILAKVHGKEQMLHDRAHAVEKKNREVINKKWQESYNATNRWIPLNELLNDRKYFPNGPPKSPYGIKYRDKNGDHKVDPPFLPVVSLMEFREKISNQ